MDRTKEELEILRAEYAKTDNERLRLQEENERLRQAMSESGVGDLQKQVTEAREILRDVIDAVIAPISKWQRGRQLIDQHVKLLNDAVLQITLLGPRTAPRSPSGNRTAARN